METTLGPAGSRELVGDLAADRPPRYAALAERVRLLVADGRVPLGARLPAERDLAAALALSRATVTAAYARLREDGWAAARQGAGTFAALPGRARTAAPGCPARWTTARSTWPTPRPPRRRSVPAAFAAALAELPRYLPEHGYHPGGLPELRARIAERYTARGLPTTPEQVLVTAGALHGVSTAFQTAAAARPAAAGRAADLPERAGRRPVARRAPPADRPRPGRPGRAGSPTAERTLAQRPADRRLPDARLPEPDRPAARRAPAGERLARALRRAGTTAVVDETLRRAVARGAAAAAAGRLRRRGTSRSGR